MHYAFVILLVHQLIAESLTQNVNIPSANSCVSKSTCKDCIQTKSCAWCMDPEFGERPRCFQTSDRSSGSVEFCREEFTHNPDNLQTILPEYDRVLTRAGSRGGSGSAHMSGSSSGSSSSSSSGSSSWSSSSHGDIVQIKPQRVQLALRIGECCCENRFSKTQ
jgi:integrin beta 1